MMQPYSAPALTPIPQQAVQGMMSAQVAAFGMPQTGTMNYATDAIDTGDKSKFLGSIWKNYLGEDNWKLSDMFTQDLNGKGWGQEITASFPTVDPQTAAQQYNFSWKGYTARFAKWIYNEGTIINDVGARTPSRVAHSHKESRTGSLRIKGRSIIARLDAALDPAAMQDLKMQIAVLTSDIQATTAFTTIDSLSRGSAEHFAKLLAPKTPMALNQLILQLKNFADNVFLLNKQNGTGWEGMENRAVKSMEVHKITPDRVVTPTGALPFNLIGTTGSQDYSTRGTQMYDNTKNLETREGKLAKTTLRGIQIFESHERALEDEDEPLNPVSGLFQFGHSYPMALKKEHPHEGYTSDRLTIALMHPEKRSWKPFTAAEALDSCEVWDTETHAPHTLTAELLKGLLSRARTSKLRYSYNPKDHDEPDVAPHFGRKPSASNSDDPLDNDDLKYTGTIDDNKDLHAYDNLPQSFNAFALVNSVSYRDKIFKSFHKLLCECPEKFAEFQHLALKHRGATKAGAAAGSQYGGVKAAGKAAGTIADPSDLDLLNTLLNTTGSGSSSKKSGSSSAPRVASSVKARPFHNQVNVRADSANFLPIFPELFDLTPLVDGKRDVYDNARSIVATVYDTINNKADFNKGVARLREAFRSMGIDHDDDFAKQSLLAFAGARAFERTHFSVNNDPAKITLVGQEVEGKAATADTYKKLMADLEDGSDEFDTEVKFFESKTAATATSLDSSFAPNAAIPTISTLFGRSVKSRFRAIDDNKLIGSAEIKALDAFIKKFGTQKSAVTKIVAAVINVQNVADGKMIAAAIAKAEADLTKAGSSTPLDQSEAIRPAVMAAQTLGSSDFGAVDSDDEDDFATVVRGSGKKRSGGSSAGPAAKRRKTTARDVNKDLGLIKRMLYRTRLTYEFFQLVIQHNVLPPFKFKLWQLFIRFVGMHTIFFQSGDQTAINVATDQTMRVAEIHSTNGVRIEARFTLGTFVRDGRRLHLTPFAFSDKVLGGHGLRMFSMSKHREQLLAGQFPADIFCCMRHPDEDPDETGVSDFCILFDPKLQADPVLPEHSEMQQAYIKMWAFREPTDRMVVPSIWSQDYFHQRIQGSRHYTVAFTGPHKSWRPNELDSSKGAVACHESGISPLGLKTDESAYDCLQGVVSRGSIQVGVPRG